MIPRAVCILIVILAIPHIIAADDSEMKASCVDRCDESYFPGRPCYCNAACEQYENCCFDFYPVCRPDLILSDDWVAYEDHRYRLFYAKSITAAEGREKCRQDGGRLVSINDPEELEFIELNVLQKRTLSAFIGGSDEEEEGIWRWPDGSLMVMPSDTWGVWYEGQPDDFKGAEDCLVMTNYMYWDTRQRILDFYVWRDYGCNFNPANEIQGYVCETTMACDSLPCQNNGLCVYAGGEKEFTCECPESYVGDVCQYKVVEGELWTECGQTELTEPEGVIQSPLYPELYPNSVRCKWLVNTASSLAISILIEDLNIEDSKECTFDYITIYDGDTSNHSVLLPRTCGKSNEKLQLVSSGNQILVEFFTDHSAINTGFRLSYQQQRCGAGTGESGCGTKRLFTSDCGETEVRSLLGTFGHSCEWLITVRPGFVIHLAFKQFHIEDTGMECSKGHVVVYNGPDATGTVIGRFCGHRFPWDIFSTGTSLLMRLENVNWDPNIDVINWNYTAIDSRDLQIVAPPEKLQGDHAQFSSLTSPLTSRSATHDTYGWLLEAPIGQKIELTWSLEAAMNATLRVYDGASEKSDILENVISIAGDGVKSQEGTVLGNSYHLLVLFTKHSQDDQAQLRAAFVSKDWIPHASGCYRPYYYNNPSSMGTENNIITDLEPVTIMVADTSYSLVNPGYDAGLYCKWLIQGEAGRRLTLEVLDALVEPVDKDCTYDGVVVYDGADTSAQKYGPFCGASSDIMQQVISSSSNELLIIFYSDSRGARRENGVFRAVVTESDIGNCSVWSMNTPETRHLQSHCGVILSPRFPGLVEPGIWFWVLQQQPEHHHLYYNLYLYYVRGPAISTDTSCKESLSGIEIAKDSSLLRQKEAYLFHLCGDTELFVPKTRFKVPPNQKVAIELNTIANTIVQRWQFKLAFTVSQLIEPSDWDDDTIQDTSLCPPDYYHYQGYCYHYYQWVLRHYITEDYAFQHTWQLSLEQCERENATLVSIHSEEEAYFIKYMMSLEWFWNPAASFQINHRMVYIGLHNRHGHYEWTDHSRLGYADWYSPPEPWEQPAMHDDTFVFDILNIESPQPNADVGSLCTAMMINSPHGSLSWAKIPCDYPVFKAGLICKTPAYPRQDKNQKVTPAVEIANNFAAGIIVCPPDWLLVNGRCILMYVNMNVNRPLTYSRATVQCTVLGGRVLELTADDYERVIRYLEIWDHQPRHGHIWSHSDPDENKCRYIKVYKRHYLEQETYYEVVQDTACTTLREEDMGAVICATDAHSKREQCGSHEFTCDDGVCISVDYVCDGHADCSDTSDENNCKTLDECDEDTFQCDNGQCISLNLRCDFFSHCTDKSDEQECVHTICGASEFRCDNGECVDLGSICDFTIDCIDGSDELPEKCESNCGGFLCYSGRCLPSMLLDDKISDCPGLGFEDEKQRDNDLLTLFEYYVDGQEFDNDTYHESCAEGYLYSQCHLGERKCYNRGATCLYDRAIVDEHRKYEVLTGCRDGADLRTHCGKVSCPGMFHCPGSYCLPYRKLCDNIKDCPGGEDEHDCDAYLCPGMLKCKDSSFCIPHSEMCDGVVHCKQHREDEKYCGVIDDICSICECRGHWADCTNQDLHMLPDTSEKAYNTTESHVTTRQLRGLQLAGNRLTLTNKSFRKLHWLTKLNISSNALTDLNLGVFSDLVNLLELDLSLNALEKLPPGVFHGLISLRHLDLSGNNLQHIVIGVLPEIAPLQHLILTDNRLKSIQSEVLTYLLYLKTLKTDAYKFCCIAKQVDVCTPEADEFSSCEDLMDNFALQISIWVLGFLAFLGNVFVISWRIITDRSKVSSFFIINLGCSDLLMGVYMLIIASVDVYYRGNYIQHADEWRSSRLCQLAGLLAMLSSEVSVFMLTSITLDRAVTIIFPLKFGHIRMKHARFVALGGWLTCLLLSIIPISEISYFGESFFGRSGVCLPFQVTNQRLPGWEYSVFIFLVLNFVSFVIIFIAYLTIFLKVKTSIKELGAQSSKSTDEYALAKKLAIIVVTDFLCWVPIILIGFAALGGASIPPQVSAWIAVFVLPLNSAVNPILYTISAIDCKKRGRKGKMPAMNSSTMSTGVSRTGVMSESTFSQDNK